MRSLLLAVLSVLLATACASSSEVPSSPPQPLESFDDKLNGSLFASPSEQKLRREHAVASELAATLKKISGILDVRVHLTLADNSLGARNPKVPNRVAILVVHGPSSPPDSAAIQKLVAAALPELTEEQVTVVLTPTDAPKPSTAFLGPLEIASSSVTAARWLIGSLIGTCLVMALALIAAGLKIRQIRRTHRR